MVDEGQGDLATTQHRVNFGEGLTPTERFLKNLGERGFLRFWSHSNPHRTPKLEVCDLLVVCDDAVLVFSDKNKQFHFGVARDVAWRRWYREAISKSASQLHGAVRHLLDLRSPIFKDKPCTVPLGLNLPSLNHARVYRIAVVSLANDDEAEQLRRPILRLDGAIIGDQHLADDAEPFRVGDIDLGSDFVHVMDLVGLRAVLGELDTITDFSRYLNAREAFLRGQPGNSADDEFCLLARYLFAFTDKGEQLPIDYDRPGDCRLDDSERQSDVTREAIRNRREANKDSYLWDWLVERQAKMIESQNFDFSTYKTVEDAERVVRHLALEPRLSRRILGKAWREACLIAEPGQAANIRTVPHSRPDGPTYVFLTVDPSVEKSEEIYRAKRRAFLEKMVLASLIDEPTSKVVIGIASELGQLPGSYDLLHFNVEEDANHETLAADARACWELKRQAFGDRKTSVLNEWDFSPP